MVRTILATFLVSAGTLGSTGYFSAAAAQTGYAWADQPSSAQYEPNRPYSYNASGGRMLVSRIGVGLYTVEFDGLGGRGPGGGHVQVTSYGQGSTTCKVIYWSSGAPNFSARIGCFASDGSPVDAMFTILAGWPIGSGGPAGAQPGAGLPPISSQPLPGGSGKADGASGADVRTLSDQIAALYHMLEILRARINELSK